MPRFTDSELLTRALAALEDVHDRAREGPVERTEELRFLLAWLGNRAREKWPFDSFWQTATKAPGPEKADQFGRRQTLTAAINGIYHQLGVKREH